MVNSVEFKEEKCEKRITELRNQLNKLGAKPFVKKTLPKKVKKPQEEMKK